MKYYIPASNDMFIVFEDKNPHVNISSFKEFIEVPIYGDEDTDPCYTTDKFTNDGNSIILKVDHENEFRDYALKRLREIAQNDKNV